MFFAASKIAWFALTPSNLLVVLAFAGTVVAALGGARAGLRVAVAAAVALLLLGFGPFGNWLLLPLENRFPPASADDASPIAGIIVLGGAVRSDVSFARGQLNLGEAGERMVAMADLARRHPGARVVFTGGSGALIEAEAAEADAVRRFGAALGIDPARILFENGSRTTWENAVETRALVQPEAGERWLLVTSAAHMPRSVGVFRQAGFAVDPYPVDYLTEGARDLYRLQPRITVGLDRLETALREWIGLVGYRLSGRSDALFPGPSPTSSVGPIR